MIRGCLATARAEARRVVKAPMSSRLFKGFCGETSHQTSLSPKRRKAARAIWRWPSWAGLKEPPIRPMVTRRETAPLRGRAVAAIGAKRLLIAVEFDLSLGPGI